MLATDFQTARRSLWAGTGSERLGAAQCQYVVSGLSRNVPPVHQDIEMPAAAVCFSPRRAAPSQRIRPSALPAVARKIAGLIFLSPVCCSLRRVRQRAAKRQPFRVLFL